MSALGQDDTHKRKKVGDAQEDNMFLAAVSNAFKFESVSRFQRKGFVVQGSSCI